MNDSSNKSMASLLKYIILYLVSMLAEGIYRLQYLNDHFISDYINIIKLSSNINMIISTLFAVFYILIILLICYLIIELFNLKVSINSVIQGFILIVLTYTFFQYIKLIVDLIFLKLPDNILIDNDDSFLNLLKRSTWYQYITIIDYLMILVGVIVFGMEMFKQENKQNIFDIFILSYVFVICNIILLL